MERNKKITKKEIMNKVVELIELNYTVIKKNWINDGIQIVAADYHGEEIHSVMLFGAQYDGARRCLTIYRVERNKTMTYDVYNFETEF